MAFQPADRFINYPPAQHPNFNSCVMLPPLRNVSPVHKLPTITLSDCSDLSAADDPTHLYPTPSRTISPVFQVVHNSPAPATSAVAPPPPTPTCASSLPHPVQLPRPPALKSKKIARARVANKPPPVTDPAVAIASFKSSTRKKVRSSKSNIPGKSRYWTPSEHKLFVQALLKYGPKDLKAISGAVGTRDMTQCRTHEQKCFMRLMRAAQTETLQREEPLLDAGMAKELQAQEKKMKQQKDVYSVPSSCGITLLCVVLEEMSRALHS